MVAVPEMTEQGTGFQKRQMERYATPMSYTLGTAAKATRKSKTTILRAIDSGKISAEKNAHGEWSIEPAELHRVYPLATNKEQGSGNGKWNDTQLLKNDDVTGELKVEVATLRERLSSFEREREQLSSQIEDLRHRLDISDEERRRLTAVLTDQRTQERPKGFWRWLVGRN
jgi:septal ring factor EnvC (AmiA/AmiB activator)